MDSEASTERPRPPRLCMEDVRCRLCLFDLEEDDMVVAHIRDEEFTQEFSIRMNNHKYDSINHVRVHACGQFCQRKGRPTALFHAKCQRFKQHDIGRVIATGKFTFEPTLYEQNRRFTRTKYFLARRLDGVLHNKLPAEILDTIAEMMVHECATITNEQKSLEEPETPQSVRLDCAVYASYSVIDGVRYVKSLTNTVPDGEKYTLLSKTGQALRGVYVAEDCRGIRAIKFCPPDMLLLSPGPITNSYWRNLTGLPDAKEIAVQSDGLKVRNMIVPGELGSDSVRHYTRWGSPKHPSDAVDLLNLDKGLSSCQKDVWMSSFDCNVKGITGYTVITDGDLTATIHAHKPGEEARFYSEIDHSWPCGLFYYMPLDEGEYVTEICRRHGKALNSGEEFSACFVFVTNKGRIYLFGAALSLTDTAAFHKIATPSPNGSQIYINEWRHDNPGQVRYLASDEAMPPYEERPIPSSLVPDFPSICTKDNGPWFTSSCSMEGASEITFCRDSELAHKPIIGMLLDYDNGHRECLGRFRFDKSLEKLHLGSNTDLYVGTGRNIWKFLYVDQVLTSPRPEKAHLRWMRIPLDGILEWWNSYQHSILRHTSFRGQATNLDDERLKRSWWFELPKELLPYT